MYIILRDALEGGCARGKYFWSSDTLVGMSLASLMGSALLSFFHGRISIHASSFLTSLYHSVSFSSVAWSGGSSEGMIFKLKSILFLKGLLSWLDKVDCLSMVGACSVLAAGFDGGVTCVGVSVGSWKEDFFLLGSLAGGPTGSGPAGVGNDGFG